ncbi:MAG: hypothetical protein RR716_07240 [Christensenellaceae bacterium]
MIEPKKALHHTPNHETLASRLFIKIAIQSKSNRKSDFGLYQRREN